jgi:hypothetical protein
MERDEMTKESLETSSPIIQRLPSIKTVACTIRVPRKLRKIHPMFGNVAKTVAKISKLKLKGQNIYTQLFLILK